jgi:hypothetical protein
VRVLTMTDEEYQQIERQLTDRLGQLEDLGWSGSGVKHALGILARATEAPKEPCGYYECDESAAAEDGYCPAHADVVQQVEAMGALG